MVVSNDLCPIQCWTVRTSKPRRSMLVAYVDRKVFRSNSSGSRPARSATSLQRLRKFCSRLPVGEGNRNRLSIVTGWLSSNSANSTGTGTSRSSQRLGKNFRSGLERTRTVLSFGLRSFQNRYITSCSRNPVKRNVENKTRSQESHATRKRDCCSSVYTFGREWTAA